MLSDSSSEMIAALCMQLGKYIFAYFYELPAEEKCFDIWPKSNHKSLAQCDCCFGFRLKIREIKSLHVPLMTHKAESLVLLKHKITILQVKKLLFYYFTDSLFVY